MLTLKVNGTKYQVDADPEEPLLWVIREKLELTGTKFGCGISECGACTVLIDGKTTRSCVTTAGEAVGTEITTIEGISPDHPVIAAWVGDQVPQCGYCHSGQIISAVALLKQNPTPTDEDINEAMSGNICRCGTYQRIRRAIHRAALTVAEGGGS